MKKLVLVFLLYVVFFESIYACSLSFPPLRKEFRHSKLVFLGKVTKLEDYYVPNEKEKLDIPDIWRKEITDIKSKSIFTKVYFEIPQRWKGNLPERKEFVAVAYRSCGCPGEEIDKFNVGEEYIIFANESNFITVCDSFRQSIEGKAKLTKKLDNFGFRFWARIYPF